MFEPLAEGGFLGFPARVFALPDADAGPCSGDESSSGSGTGENRGRRRRRQRTVMYVPASRQEMDGLFSSVPGDIADRADRLVQTGDDIAPPPKRRKLTSTGSGTPAPVNRPDPGAGFAPSEEDESVSHGDGSVRPAPESASAPPQPTPRRHRVSTDCILCAYEQKLLPEWFSTSSRAIFSTLYASVYYRSVDEAIKPFEADILNALEVAERTPEYSDILAQCHQNISLHSLATHFTYHLTSGLIQQKLLADEAYRVTLGALKRCIKRKDVYDEDDALVSSELLLDERQINAVQKLTTIYLRLHQHNPAQSPYYDTDISLPNKRMEATIRAEYARARSRIAKEAPEELPKLDTPAIPEVLHNDYAAGSLAQLKSILQKLQSELDAPSSRQGPVARAPSSTRMHQTAPDDPSSEYR